MGSQKSKLAGNAEGDSEQNAPTNVSKKYELHTISRDDANNSRNNSLMSENLPSNNGGATIPVGRKFFKLVNRSFDVDAEADDHVNWSNESSDKETMKDIEFLQEVGLPEPDVTRYTRHFADDKYRRKWKQSKDSERSATNGSKSAENTKQRKPGVAFTVKLGDNPPLHSVHPPSRILVDKHHDFRISDYTCQEKCIMAEIMRQNILDERVAKAAICDQRREEAKRRRQQMLADEKGRQIQKMKNAHPAVTEQERKLKILAHNTKKARIAASRKDL